ncbi:MAG: ABC transporter ATP-binding protein [Capsulimonadaceae bacterium]|nr:ABC transporter ATP-binding protein [Capsulimonadaceae bacterium]
MTSTTQQKPASPLDGAGAATSSDGRKLSQQARLFSYALPDIRIIVIGGLCAVGQAVASMSIIPLLGKVIDGLMKANTAWLLFACVGVVLVYVIRGLFTWGQVVCFSELSQRISVRLKSDIYNHLQKLSLSFFDGEQTGNLISTISNDVPVLTGGIISLKDMLSAPIVAIGGIVIVFYISTKLTLLTIFGLPVIVMLLNAITKKLRSISIETQNRLADLTTTTEETLGGVRLVRAFVAEDREIQRFSGQVNAAKMWFMKGVYRSAALQPVGDLVGAIAIAIAIFVGGHEVTSKQLSVEYLGMFVYTLEKIRTGVSTMSNIMVTWRTLQGAADRVFKHVLDVPTQVMEKADAIALPKVQGEVRFDHVDFEYLAGHPVLCDIDFTMHPGNVVAIVGESGSGKSTLSDLIPRFYDPTAGRILVDGYDIRDVTLASLRRQIGIVDQVTNLFGGTVRENIAYGRPDATAGQVEAAARYANAHDFIMQMPSGYDTIVGQRGVQLSGGQRQRLAIARALLTDPRILILDEATSSLDSTSEQLVQEALDKLMHGRTTLVIAHRLSTIVKADRILVLHKGTIVEAGTHAELLALHGRYAYLHETQYGVGETTSSGDAPLDAQA